MVVTTAIPLAAAAPGAPPVTGGCAMYTQSPLRMQNDDMTARTIKAPVPSGKGKVERALDRDLSRLPENLREGALAASARLLAKRLDGGLSARDAITASRELRTTMAKLSEAAPIQKTEDVGDDLQARRQKRLAEAEAAGG